MTTSTMTVTERMARLRRHGAHAQAWATLQPGVTYLDVVTPAGASGFVALRRALGTAVVLGDPVCDAADRDAVVDAVVERLPRSTLFFQVGDEVAARLRERHGLRATPLGVEAVVDVATFTLRGRHKQTLRSALNHAARRGLEIVEVPPAQIDDEPARRWHLTRRRRRLGFIVPPPRLPGVDEQPGTGRRAFIARQGGEALGFVIFDPLHDAGHVVGWTPSVSCGSMRFRPGLWYALVTRAIERFRDEGAQVVNLGLAPLAPMPPATSRSGSPSGSTSLLGLAFAMLRRVGLLYNFRGVEHAKRRFGGALRPSFIAHRGPLPLRGLFALWWLVARG